MELDGIVGPVYRSQQMTLRHHGRVDPGFNMVTVIAADGE